MSSGNMLTGLTESEVQERMNKGLSNVMQQSTGKTTKEIIKENVFTYFNGIFLLLAVLLIIAGSFNSLTFLPVIILNTVIGIIQQLQSKKVLDKLTLLSISEYEAVRDGKKKNVRADLLVKDDLIFLSAGQQIPADAVVISGSLSVNESLLTGESDEIVKTEGMNLMSGSFIVSGKAVCRLTKVGDESYVSQLTAKAKEIKEKQSEMIRSIEAIVKTAGILIIPIGICLFVQSFVVQGNGFTDSIVSMVGCVIGMIPEGLYLLVTIALAMSAARLAYKKVLLHDMKSIETLARVDVLCVDKTGTITDNAMNVTDFIFAGDNENKHLNIDGNYEASNFDADQKSIINDFQSYIVTVPDQNQTAEALKQYFSESKAEKFDVTEVNPFDSKKKYSEVKTADHTYRFGAPEFLLTDDEKEKFKDDIDSLLSEGKRVLAFVEDDKALFLIALTNHIRESAYDTFTFFKKQNVGIKVISGDNPVTVSNVALTAGIDGAEKYIDLSTLKTKDELNQAVLKYNVFGRVRPEQKKDIIKALKKQGRKVAMTGDGVNDILAMKEADCSIAMGSGCEAAANAAQVVLLDSDFSHMKDIVAEGRRDINNITRSATLFLYKNFFSLFLAIFSIITIISYPLKPSQVTMISFFNIGVPAFFLAFEDNFKKQQGSFTKNVIRSSMPAAITSFLSIAALVVFGQVFKIPQAEIGVASTFLLAIVGFMILFQISQPMNRYRWTIFFGCIAGMVFGALVLPGLFAIHGVSMRCFMLFTIFAISEYSVMEWLTKLFSLSPKRKK
jgi:cation-transporting ATPase E